MPGKIRNRGRSIRARALIRLSLKVVFKTGIEFISNLMSA